MAVLAGGLGLMVGTSTVAGWLATAGLLGMIAAGLGGIGRFGTVVLGIAAAASAALILRTPDGGGIVMAGLGRASLFGALICAVAFLQEAARSSRLVVEAGEALVRRRGRTLFSELFVATHASGLVLNFGVIAVLSPLVEAAARSDPEPGLRRRLYLALLRGFATTTMWSPLSVAYLATLIVVPGLDGSDLALCGLGTAIIFLALGTVIDRLEQHRSSAGVAPRPALPQTAEGARPLLRLGGLVLLILLVAWAGSMLLGSGLLAGVLLTAPVVGAVWAGGGMPSAQMPARMLHYGKSVAAAMPGNAGDVAVLAGTAYLGYLAGVLAGGIAPGGWFQMLPWPGLAIPILASWCIVLFALAGVGPLITVFGVASLIGAPADLGIPPLVLGVALMGGWGISVSLSSAGAALRVVARSARKTTSEVGVGWNGAYSLAGALLLPLWLAVVWQFA